MFIADLISACFAATRRMVLGLALCLPAAAVTAQDGLDPNSEIAPFAAAVARRHGLDEAALISTLAEARVLSKVLEAMSRPAEAKPWKDYRPIFLVERRIADGARYWREHARTLDAAAQRFGVDPRVIVAIIGVETLYGQRAGNIRVVDALATLGFRYPKRAEFFLGELEQYMLLGRDESLDLLQVKGSYAGAMGIGQFIPSSYREYAVDFDGDGRRDLIASHEDAIGSVASYLSRHGWQRNGEVAVSARISAGGDALQQLLDKGVKPHTELSGLRDRGIVLAGEVTGSPPAALIELEGDAGVEYWVVFQNFYVITRYNRSNLYAMAVHQLAMEIEARYRRGGA